MINLVVDDRKVQVKDGDTILDAIREAGYDVPTLCHMKDFLPTGTCRMCVVEVEGWPGLVPSCSYPASEGMKVKINGQRSVQARKTIVELLLSSHPDDCLYCSRNGNCELSDLAKRYGVTERHFPMSKKALDKSLDASSMALTRDPAKCILCGKCVRVCEETQGVAALDFINRGSEATVGCAFNEGINVSSCINCGQCIKVCPTGALTERKHLKEVLEALRDPNKHVVVQHAPAISVTVAEEFNMKAGLDIAGKLNAALKRIGFDRVFDTSFTADLTIMEEGSELIERIKSGKNLPMMTSCSPGWIKFVEEFYPEFLENLSTCKSPQQMLGAIVKSYYAEKNNVDPKSIYSVSIMPCTAKKFEASRPEMASNNVADIDAVLTTRELAELIKIHGIKMDELAPEYADMPFGKRSTAGKLFGVSGGVMEAAVRTVYYVLTGEEMEKPKLKAVRGLSGVKTAKLNVGETELGIAVVSGTANAKQLLEEIKAGKRNDIHFIEIMGCPGGCINGGGQPIGQDPEVVKARMQALYNLDQNESLQKSHLNEDVQLLYSEYLGEPLGHKSHELLHTSYKERKVLK